ncbi:hypothetical protein [uncultured Methanolobus sp.]|uniref:hypothetical protein n=1 Tax=uncultured Methanolobus sp. TaxID=218300 RepID=UPI002AAC2530|nr:hypothetical protein [uncultured Methanolobus sp.]
MTDDEKEGQKQAIIIIFLILFTLLCPPIGIILLILYLRQNNKSKRPTRYKTEELKKLNELKGDQFEHFIEKLFDEEEFEIISKTEDLMRIKKGFHEEDMKPDFLIRNIATGHNFYVECKYRSDLFENKYKWSSYKQMCRYMRYALLNRIPCFIVLGLDGAAFNPKKIYCIPIQNIKYPELYPSQFEGYYHDPNESFQWEGNRLT